MRTILRFKWTGYVVGCLAVGWVVATLPPEGFAAEEEGGAGVHRPQAEHVDQFALTALVTRGQSETAFERAFELGDELFGVNFNALDGVGAHVGQGQRFTRVPRADLNGFGEWANHTPRRATGPNAEACAHCHATPAEDGAGPAFTNVIRDPFHAGEPRSFINRNTPHLFGIGAVQRLAEEMTAELHSARHAAALEAGRTGRDVRKPLHVRGIDFGAVIARPDGSIDTSAIRGVDPDLVIRPFQWKGSMATIRAFNRDAAHNELGMQAVEIAGADQDGDADGVVNELTVGDLTALTIYNAAQPRPTTRTELASLGLIPRLSSEERESIANGEAIFDRTGCAVCHVKSLLIRDPVFREPSHDPNFRDAVFPAGQDPASWGLNPNFPVVFDLTRDHPDNRITDGAGRLRFRLGSFERDRQGRAIVRLFGDLKRHDMGPGLAEAIDEEETGAAVFLTENLWGVGSTAPYLHDGRATTLTEAIVEHGGEAAPARSAFQALPTRHQRDLIAFLNNLVLFKMEVDESTETSPDPKPRRRSRR